MALEKKITLSVHDLVDFLFRTGDIDNRVYNQDTMSRGSEIHTSYQRKRIDNYLSEYYLRNEFDVDGFKVVIEGKADGIIDNDIPIIEELKSTVEDIDIYYKKNKKWHLSQAICYAYMFLNERHKKEADIKLVYISQIDEKQKVHKSHFTFEVLEKKIISYIHDYLNFYIDIYNARVMRNASSVNLTFPFASYRKGQEQFITLGDNIAKDGGIAFIEAPTGIGKTISALYPFAKSFKDEYNEKIFYLTAKNTGKDAAYKASKLMIENGLKAKAIYITAKEKICASIGAACNPDECPFAKEYYTKLRKAISETIKNESLFDTKKIKEIANKYKICPFEFSLDLSLYNDIIIADYNYFFDPIVHLERYFDEDSSHYLILVDEAHNLLDRSREMYSEELSYALFKAFKNDYRYADKNLKRAIKRVDKLFLNLLASSEIGSLLIDDIDHETYLALNNLFTNINEYQKENTFHPSDESIDFSRRLNRFLKLYEMKLDQDSLYIEKTDEKNVSLNLYCLDASSRIRESLENVKGAILFSATLTPFDYYIDVLGGDKEDNRLLLPSPFPKDNFRLLISPIDVRYKNRDITLMQVINSINSFTNSKKGNYLIFAPSFEYLDKLLPFFNDDENKIVVYQNKEMDDFEKKLFLNKFKEKSDKSTIGLVVIGGAFSEGIDLVADSLIGVVIIGVGMPTISFRNNLIKDYYQNKEIDINGFSYAYKHPGMNKVSQAVGRLIRSESDIGAALLIDSRYLTNEYRRLFKKEWNDYEVVIKEDDIKEVLSSFWYKKR